MSENLCIRVLAGETAGASVVLEVGGTVSVGRSRSNELHVTEPDVSARHMTFRRGMESALTAEVISSRHTEFNGTPVDMGSSFPVKAGDRFRLGKTLLLSVERDESASDDNQRTVPPPTDKTVPPPTGKTVPPKSQTAPCPPEAPQDDELKTIAVKTRIASDEEIENIRKSLRTKRRLRALKVILPVMLFLAVSFSAYIALKPQVEDDLTWPSDDAGRYQNHFELIKSYFGLAVPDSPGISVRKDGPETVIETRIGKLLDVPFRVSASAVSAPDALRKDREPAFSGWLAARRNADRSFNPSPNRKRLWMNCTTGGGVLYDYVQYTRRIGDDDWWGYAVFFRNGADVCSALMEVPLRERSRSEVFFASHLRGIVLFAPARTMDVWEGTDSYRRETTVGQDIAEAEQFLKSNAPTMWENVYYRLRSALIKATIAGNSAQVDEARSLLSRMREKQGEWYARQKFAWERACLMEDAGGIEAVQSLGEAVFTREFADSDYRYDSIRRKEWR